MRPNLGLAIVGGLVGTPAMSAAVCALAPLIGVKTDIVDVLATMLGGWTLGMIVHVINGAIIFPLAYAILFYRHVPGTPPARGVAFGLVLWLASQLIVLPALGLGLFSAQMGGLKGAGASLVGHLMYGLLLGGLAGSAIEVAAVPSSQTKQAA